MAPPIRADALESALNACLGVNLRDVLPELIDPLLESIRAVLGPTPDSSALRHHVSPQWVVLAAGRGTRIDPTGRLNKNLDIWFGSRNTLHLACAHLPGDRPPVIVINPNMARRVIKLNGEDAPADVAGELDPRVVDSAARDDWFGRDARLVVQPTADGTGGALRAAADVLRRIDAGLIGVAFGDEPFLDRRLFLETLVAHLLSDADATLCGKRPDAVVDKGGLFFDDAGRFVGTREWYDMTDEEQRQMRTALARREAITNTGISIFRRDVALDRLPRLWTHKDGTEYHHVDLFRLCYEDGLKTHAHVYEGPIRSGINRWANVSEGERHLFAEMRKAFADAGARVRPDADISVGMDHRRFFAEDRLGVGCVLGGRTHLDAAVRIGDYSVLDDATVTGETTVGRRARITRSRLHNVRVCDADDDGPVGAPIDALACLTTIEDCRLSHLVVGPMARLTRVEGDHTIIPDGSHLSDTHVGIRRDPSLGMPSNATPVLWEFVPESYLPGAFTFGQKRGLPDWERLRAHVFRMMEEEVAIRATSHTPTRAFLCATVRRLLDARFADETMTDALTPEELWGLLYDLTRQITGNADPYAPDKRRSRAEAIRLAAHFRPDSLDWDRLLRLDVAANLIDLTSVRMIERIEREPAFLEHALDAAQSAELAIDSTAAFEDAVLSGDARRILWLTDNDGEFVFDLYVIRRLLSEGHHVTIAARSFPASNDVTAADVHATIANGSFADLLEAVHDGRMNVIGSGSNTVGTNLYRATPTFVHALREADLVLSKGQGNWYTTQGLRRDVFYLFLSKGMTAERTTGVQARPDRTIDGLILAFVPRDATWRGTLAEFAVTYRRTTRNGR